MIRSDILTSLNFYKEIILSPGLEKLCTLQKMFPQFFNITMYIRVVGKIPDPYINVKVSSNPGDKS